MFLRLSYHVKLSNNETKQDLIKRCFILLSTLSRQKLRFLLPEKNCNEQAGKAFVEQPRRGKPTGKTGNWPRISASVTGRLGSRVAQTKEATHAQWTLTEMGSTQATTPARGCRLCARSSPSRPQPANTPTAITNSKGIIHSLPVTKKAQKNLLHARF